MNFPQVHQYKFDIDGSNPENVITDEPITVEAGVWSRVFVPRHAPFFVDSLTVTTKTGEPLVKDTDYQIFKIMGELTAYCATPVACMVELINPNLTDVKVSYKTVGEATLFDKTMYQLIIDCINDDRPVWWDNITNKPVVFPPQLHNHSWIYEICCFQDFVDLVTYFIEYVDSTNDEVLTSKITTYIDLVDYYTKMYGDMITRLLERHKAAYNAHGLTDLQVQLENVDNFATATQQQALTERDDLHITPPSLKAIINEYGYDSNEYLVGDALPLSRYGSGTFIPPSISGTFEGLGGVSECAAMCLEANGDVTYLVNHYDGQTEGIYFTTFKGYPNTLSATYSGYKYIHPAIEAAGVSMTQVCMGSGGEALMLYGGGRYWVGVTNGTLDPSKHVMTELDLTPIKAVVDNAYVTYTMFWVGLMGDYLVVSCSSNTGQKLGNDQKHFFRIPISDVKSKTKVTPTLLKLSYTDFDGKVVSNANSYIWGTTLVDGTGRVTKALLNFKQSVDPNNGGWFLYRSPLTISCKHPTKAGIWLIKFLSHFYCTKTDAGYNSSFSFTPTIGYEFNPATGVMTLINHSPVETIDFDKNPAGGVNYSVATPNFLVASFSNQNAIVLPDGNILCSITNEVTRSPHSLMEWLTHKDSAYALMSSRWEIDQFQNSKYDNPSSADDITSPLPNANFPSTIGYDTDGEFFTARYKTITSKGMLMFRKVTGDYAVRSTFTNTHYPNLQSRVLTNEVYATNLDNGISMACVTGDAATLGTMGLSNLGAMDFCVGHSTNYWNTTTADPVWQPKTKDLSVRFARGFSKALDANGIMQITPSAWTTYPAAIVQNLINQVVPAAYRNSPAFVVSIADLTHFTKGTLPSRPVVVLIQYADVAGNSRRGVVCTIKPTYNTSDSKEYSVTGFTVISSKENVIRTNQTGLTSTSWNISWTFDQKGQDNTTSFYYTGTQIIGVINTRFTTNYTGNSALGGCFFAMDRTTHVLVDGSSSPYNQNWEGTENYIVIPKVGYANRYTPTDSGGVCNLARTSANVVYGLSSPYLSGGWTVYFTTDESVVFNGRQYTLPAGSINLLDLDPSPGNKTFYVYARLNEGTAEYYVTVDPLPDSVFQMWIATITTNATQVETIDRFNVFSMNGYRVSEVKRGGAIPASSGLITEQGQIPWVKQSELL